MHVDSIGPERRVLAAGLDDFDPDAGLRCSSSDAGQRRPGGEQLAGASTLDVVVKADVDDAQTSAPRRGRPNSNRFVLHTDPGAAT